MRGLLLDNQIAPVVARQVRVHRPDCPIESLHRWRDGEFVRSSDARILAAAAEEGLVLITRDLRTIPGLLRSLALAGQSHGGVVLIDDRTIDERDVGGLVRALVEFWEEYREVDLASTVVHLKRASAC